MASCDAAFSCLLRLRGQSGVSGVGAIHRRNIVDGETLSVSRLIELANDLGLKAEHVRLDWQHLQTLGFSRPLLVLLKNTNVIVLTGGARGGSSEVAVWDPLNPFEELLFAPREDFERVWTGHALIITTPPSNGAGTSPSLDLCWLTSAGLELLGRTSARWQNPKLVMQAREKTATHLEPAAGKEPRQINQAVAAATRAKPTVVQAPIAMGGRPRAPAADAQPQATASPVAGAEARHQRLVRLYMAAGVILVAAGVGTLLFRSSGTDPIATAIALAKEVWTVAPTSTRSTSPSIASIARTGYGSIPAAQPATSPMTPPNAPNIAAPSAKPALPVTTSPSVAAAPPAPPDAPDVTPASAKPALPLTTAPSVAAAPPEPLDAPDLTTASAKPAPPLTTPSRVGAAPTAPSDAPDIATSSTERGLAMPTTTPDPKAAPPPSTADLRSSAAADTGALLARGDSLLSIGDVASARLFYERAVDEGGGLAAIRLGETFDPLFLDRAHIRGIRSDPGAALFWYRRARDLGVNGAEALLEALEAK